MLNRISVTIPADVKQKVDDAIALIRQELTPYLYPLTPDERQGIVKMGDRSLGFMTKIDEYGTATPAFVPAFVDFKEMKLDIKATSDLAGFFRPLQQLATDTESTMMQTGGEAYTDALVVYRNIQSAAKSNVPGAQVAYEELKGRFAGQGKEKKNPASDTQ